jgi:hypothetical protein
MDTRSDPFDQQSIVHLSKAMTAHKADIGIRINADASALTVFDKNGKKYAEEDLFLWLAKLLLQENPEAVFAVDHFTHPDIIAQLNLPEKQIIYHHGDWEGFYAKKETIKEPDMLFSCEGRFLFKNRFRFIEDGFAAGIHILNSYGKQNPPEKAPILPQPEKHVIDERYDLITFYQNYLKALYPELPSSPPPRYFSHLEGQNKILMRLDAPGHARWMWVFGPDAAAIQERLCLTLSSFDKNDA